MRTIVTGIIVFILWSVLCTWYYLNYIKVNAADKAPPPEELVADTEPAAEDTAAAMVEPGPTVKSPGSFTVYHDFNKSKIISDPDFDNYIEKLVDYADEVTGSKLKVTGHTDNVGSENYNYRLGMERAQSTRDYLVKMGISEQIISISSEGESSPVATNDTETGRSQNRRTEVHINE